MMKLYLLILMMVSLVTVMMGCASDSLEAPCPYYGANCKKIPVNSWDYLN